MSLYDAPVRSAILLTKLIKLARRLPEDHADYR